MNECMNESLPYSDLYFVLLKIIHSLVILELIYYQQTHKMTQTFDKITGHRLSKPTNSSNDSITTNSSCLVFVNKSSASQLKMTGAGRKGTIEFFMSIFCRESLSNEEKY